MRREKHQAGAIKAPVLMAANGCRKQRDGTIYSQVVSLLKPRIRPVSCFDQIVSGSNFVSPKPWQRRISPGQKDIEASCKHGLNSLRAKFQAAQDHFLQRLLLRANHVLPSSPPLIFKLTQVSQNLFA